MQSVGVVDLFTSADSDGDPRINQVYSLFGAGADGVFGSTALASIDTTGLAQAGDDVFSFSSIDLEGAQFQFLRFDLGVASIVSGNEEGTLVREIDIALAVPEPSSAALLGLGSLGLLLRRRR